jgi:large subunit ribosomal protein L6
MSRIGKAPISLPKGVELKVNGRKVEVKGPKGSLELDLLESIDVNVAENEVVVSLTSGNEEKGNFHGLFRSLINNMVVGVTQGFEKKLEMQGVGYRAAVKGSALDLQLGFSHPTIIPIPTDIKVAVDKNTKILISGSDKQKIGQFAAQIRALRPPEPYKGKGIRYEGEYVRRKAGKTAKK